MSKHQRQTHRDILFAAFFLLNLTNLSNVLAATSETPFVFWHSQPVKGGETLMLQGANFTPKSIVEWCSLTDGEPGKAQTPELSGDHWSWRSLDQVQTTEQVIQSILPSGDSAVFACRVRNGSSAGAIHRINAPDPWFAIGDQGETATPGGWVGVFGTCIDLEKRPSSEGPLLPGKLAKAEPLRDDSIQPLPRLALVSNGITVMNVTARSSEGTRFGQFFDLPENLNPGTYDLYVHNGHGGPLGWSKLDNYYNETPISTMTVAPRTEWPQTEVNLAQLKGTDDERFAAAISKIPQGGVIVVPSGHYSLTTPLILPNKCLIRGDGMKKTCLEWTTDPKDDKGKPSPLLRGSEFIGNKDLWNKRASFSLEDLTLLASPTFSGTVISRQSTKEPAHFQRIAIRATNLNPSDARMGSGNSHPLAILLNFTRNLTVTGCEIEARNGIHVNEEGQYLRFNNNHFRWRNVSIWLMRSPGSIVIDHNRFSMAGTWAGNGFIRADNQNPGFAFAGYGHQNARGLYYANNITDSEEQEPPDASIGITTDKGPASYFGQLQSASGTKLILSGKTCPTNKVGIPPCYSGAGVRIVSGTGAGQSRILLSTNTTDISELEVDHPWDVNLDKDSWVAVSNFVGKALFVGNRFSCNPLLQTYFVSQDLIYADNTIGVPGIPVQVVLWAMGGINSWHYQVIDNRVTDWGASMKTKIRALKELPGYTAPVTCGQIYRNNTSMQPQSSFTIEIPNQTLGYLIENNKGLKEIVSAKDTYSLGLVRSNTDTSNNSVTSTNTISK